MAATTSTRNRIQTTPRHVWLAALGAVSMARREAFTAAAVALDGFARLRRDAAGFAGGARNVARGAAYTVQEQVEPQLARVSAEVEARLAPILEKLGVSAKPAPVRRKPRKSAKAPARRRAANRKQAATRVARKGRG